ncbi:MFS transporter [Amycolatopsis bartoniae]
MLGRLPMGMTSLTLILLVRSGGDSYVDAGLVTAAFTVGIALLQPLAAIAVDRYGASPVLCVLGVALPVTMILLLLSVNLHAPLVLTLLAAVVAAGTLPPLGPCMRALWRQVVKGPALDRAYAFEATAQQGPVIAGPFLVTALVYCTSAGVALIIAAFAGTMGAILFAKAPIVAAVARTRSRAADIVVTEHVRLLAQPGLQTILTTSALMAMSAGAITLSVPAFAEGHGSAASAGLILGSFAAGSIFGGMALTFVRLRADTPFAYTAALAVSAGTAVLLVVVNTIPWMMVVAWAVGLPTAPSAAISFALLNRHSPAHRITTAFGFFNSAITGGTAAGSALCGALLQSFGSAWGFMFAVGLGGLSALVCILRYRSLQPRKIC